MLVYRSDTEERSGSAVWRGVINSAEALSTDSSDDAAVALLVALGEAESGIADSLFPDRDGIHPLADALREASVAAAQVVLASERQPRNAVGVHIAALQRSLATIPVHSVPERMSISVSEGYAYYALRPEHYAESARQFLAEADPRHAVIIGIRSIGTSLSAIVSAALANAGVRVETYSVRPRGHPFDRHLAIEPALANALAPRNRGTAYLVVDEGPGLSGSSFAAVVTALASLGAQPDSIALFPSWNPDGSAFKSDSARRIWQRHRRYCVERAIEPGESAVPFKWRELLFGDREWPASHPQHERLKWVTAGSGDLASGGRPTAVLRFAGLGHYGQARHVRAETLAAHGLGPAPIALQNGILALPFVDGTPCDLTDASAALVDAIATHTAAVTRLFPAPRRPDINAVQHMIETNVRESLGDDWLASVVASDDERRALENAPSAAIDGRMLAHEWLRTASGFTKVDTLDHHADHFFPGTQDAAWDLASAAIEFDLPSDARERLVRAYIRASGDHDVSRRLRFHERAYLAFRLGYATLACDTLAGTSEAARFDRLVSRYRERLKRTLAERQQRP